MKLTDNALDPTELFSNTRLQTGLTDFGDAQIALRLTVLCDSIDREANLHRVGRFLIRNYLSQLLQTRLALEQSWKIASPVRGTIESPIFITGIPRSGSTFLHELLAADKNNRALTAWEMLEPIGRSAALRKLRTALSLWVFRRLAPGADSVHPLRAGSPHECVSLHSYTFLSREFGTMLRVPTYDAFLDQTDFTPAYLWQKRFMERAQSGGPVRRWVLKAPDHAYSLDALFKVFPDAIIIQTHREPVQVIKSATRMAYVLRKAFSKDLNIEEIARGETEALQQKISQITKFREQHPHLEDRFIDVTYNKLITHPLKIVRQIYDRLGLSFTAQVEENVMRLASLRARYSQKGLSRQVRNAIAGESIDAAQFAPYMEKFGVSSP